MANLTRKKKFDPRQLAFTRFMLVVAFFTFWMLGIGVRLVHLQVNQHEWLKEKADIQRTDIKKTRTLRGTIYDRDDHILATSVRVKTLYANPMEIINIEQAAKTLAKVLKVDGSNVIKQITEGKTAKKQFVAVLKKVDEDTVQKVNKALDTDGTKKGDLPRYEGLHWMEDQLRRYPYESLAAQVIGMSNLDDTGIAGIEQSQDELLHGAIIKKIQQRDRRGSVYDETVYDREQPADIALTIGTEYQYISDQALKNGLAASNAKSGTVLVLSVKTGEILAMSSSQVFDPNSPKGATPDSLINHNVQSTYSPGSTFKLVTYSSALEKKLFSPDDQIDAGNGTIEVANHKFSDSHHVGTVSYSQALAHSSNVCAIKTGLRVGKDDFWAMLQKMGFGSKTGIELPAETVGIVRSPDRWNGDSLASMSIGYEIAVTPLQMATAFATIANDGVKIQPRIIKEIRKPEEKPVPANKPENVRVTSVETARNMRTMLKQVVLTGTGRRAQLNGYTAAGKTGTAWKVDPRTRKIDPSKYVSSFVGMAPADNPEIVVVVVVDEPKVGARDGGMVAAPIFKAIADQILPAMNIAQDGAPSKVQTTVAQDIPETRGSFVDKNADKAVDKKLKTDDKHPADAKRPVEPAKRAKDGKRENDKRSGAGKRGSGSTLAWVLYRKISDLETVRVT